MRLLPSLTSNTLRGLVLAAALLAPFAVASLAIAESGAHRNPPPPPAVTDIALADAD